jgi:CRISPR/Cas system-associated endoribonuclease Cas2
VTYLITYDLDKPGQAYHAIISALDKAGGVRILYSTWLLVSNENGGAVRDRYNAYLDTNDRIFVTSVDNWAYRNIMNQQEASRLLPP